MIKPLTKEEIDAAQAKLRAELGIQRKAEIQGLTIKNIEAVDRLAGAPASFTFRAMRFEVVMLPYREGVRLQDLWLHLAKFEQRPEDHAALVDLLEVLEALAAFFYRNSRPVRRLHRLAFRVLPNPFRDANAAEIAQLVVFYLSCQMRSSVRYDLGTSAPDVPAQ